MEVATVMSHPPPGEFINLLSKKCDFRSLLLAFSRISLECLLVVSLLGMKVGGGMGRVEGHGRRKMGTTVLKQQ